MYPGNAPGLKPFPNFHLFYPRALLGPAQVTLPYFTFARSGSTCTFPVLGQCDSTAPCKLYPEAKAASGCVPMLHRSRGLYVHSGTAWAECGHHTVIFWIELLISSRSKGSGGLRVLETSPLLFFAQSGCVCLLNRRVNCLDWCMTGACRLWTRSKFEHALLTGCLSAGPRQRREPVR